MSQQGSVGLSAQGYLSKAVGSSIMTLGSPLPVLEVRLAQYPRPSPLEPPARDRGCLLSPRVIFTGPASPGGGDSLLNGDLYAAFPWQAQGLEGLSLGRCRPTLDTPPSAPRMEPVTRFCVQCTLPFLG